MPRMAPGTDPFRHHGCMDRHDIVYATISANDDPNLYTGLAGAFGDRLAGWETGDSLYIGVGTGRDPISLPEKPKRRLRPSEARIQNGIDTLVELVRAVRSMDTPLSDKDNDWQPTKQARKRLETLVEYVLRGDAKWRNEHPEDEW